MNNESRQHRIWPMARVAMLAIGAVLIMARFLPTWFYFAGDGSDAGWPWAINVAAARGMQFGRDVIFTYGPYGDVITRSYYPGLSDRAIFGAALMGGAFVAGLVALDSVWVVLLIGLLLPLIAATDALVFVVPLPALLACAHVAPGQVPRRSVTVAAFALMPALGLMPLTKFSLLPVPLVACALMMVFLWQNRQPKWALALPVLAGSVFAALWIEAGQQASTLPIYIRNHLQIVRGYNNAMATAGDNLAPAITALAFGVMFALIIWRGRQMPRLRAGALTSGLAALAFVVFKAGFVRQDVGHAYVVLPATGLMFIILAGWLQWRSALPAAALGIAFIMTPSLWDGPYATAATEKAGLSGEIQGLPTLFSNRAELGRRYADSLAKIPKLPWSPTGTSDTYSSLLSRLFKAGLAWSPRPVFESYSAYTPVLARINANHLIGANAPDNIFFRPEPVDFRLPSLEDGPSWPALLSLYDPVGYDAATTLAWLRRAPQDRAIAVPDHAPEPSLQHVGSTVPLPAATALWASIDAAPTLRGSLAALLFRAPPLRIRLDLADGQHVLYRFVPGMGSPGFLLSPLVTTTTEFLRLRPGPPGATPPPRVASMALLPSPGGKWAWQKTYTLAISPIAFPKLVAPIAITGAAVPVLTPPPPATPANTCYLDSIDGSRGAPQRVRAFLPLRLDGWALFDRGAVGNAAVLPSRIDIGFQSADGALFAAPAQIGPRSDVVQAFHLPQGARPGFSAQVDLTPLPAGSYTVVVLTHAGAAARACPMATKVDVAPGL